MMRSGWAMRKRSPVGQVRGKTALITGASRGIGLAIVRALAQQGCNLILTSRDESALTRISRELSRRKIRVLTHPCDVRDPYSVDDLFRVIRRDVRRIDILVNNAGIAHLNLHVENIPYPV
jgi:3-oxoacyl-[acyl-carrier protein] reductase